ncbi:hypothetical protein ACFQ88_29785 [Paenibacillus sp. NPDC056579]|uniref:hypothetical protein n=1 Tax=unclassified Paenibacillus TaxID=185978 RepID=UPI001EF93C8B|nr:hypothetical protein [Paenibacillus sp. H1-7]ULL19375.1 hypothetical protein DVH26_36120 [Paenibacillus sp. H1-7]
MHWTQWTLDRMIILFVAIAFFAIWVQVTLSHYRQNFHHKSMWAPIIASPLFSVTGLALAMVHAGWLVWLFTGLMWVGVLIGSAGFYYHFHGVGVRVGGWTMRNFLVGPPVIMPVLFIAMCALGLIVMYWR